MTQETKYTPAPWHMSRGTEVTTIIANKRINPYKHVGRVYGENRDANAHLIAAAPDMLDLLQQFIFLDDGMDAYVKPDLMQDTRNLLKKIQGQTS